jgi:predicted transcriptional regulator
MKRIPLAKYLEGTSQAELAKAVGVHQTAISRMLRVNRPIFVIEHKNGTIELVEERVKKIGGQSAA